jgi:hypothetical protein
VTEIKDPRDMTIGELLDAYDFLVGYGQVLSGPFPEERAVAIAHELGRRVRVDGGGLYDNMRRAWQQGDGKPWRKP